MHRRLLILYCAMFVTTECVRTVAENAQPAAKDDFLRNGTKEKRQAKDALEGKSPPALRVFDWNNTGGKEVKLAELKGKVVLLHLWGVWSDECKAVIPKVKKLHAKHEAAGLAIVGIHTTRQGGKMAEFVKAQGIAWPVAIDKVGETVQAYAVDDFPAYYLIDRKGVLRVADLAENDLERAVEVLLKE